ncbi:MAG TPA: DoxX family membrane protein [Gemmatimonadaceae bacterium]|nr:DoxX family membrane protein [Gemmatimonadaceae bacterium]
MLTRRSTSDLGHHVFGAAAIAFGIIGLVWGDFATVWQPVQATVPHRTLLAYLFALALLGGGTAVHWRRTARPGYVVLALLYLIAAMLWLPRIIHYPQLFGVWSGFGEELALVMAAAIALVASRRPIARREVAAAEVCRVAFGVCVVTFGIVHFTALDETARMVPSWLPPGQRFWAFTTGLAHLCAGVAIVSGLQARLASRLLAAMFLTFGALVWLPSLIASPRGHIVWAGNAINLAMAGAAWIVADWISDRQRETEMRELQVRDEAQ